MEEKKYPIGGFAPGNYTCKCCICKQEFQGDKRAVQCESCAVKALRELLKPYEQPGAVWVRASEFKIEYGPNYYAQWLDGKIKATGWFQESDGTFFWNVPGYVPISKDEYDNLLILDESESPAAGREEDAINFAEWANSNYSKRGSEMKWIPRISNRHEMFTTGQLYELFKQQKEK